MNRPLGSKGTPRPARLRPVLLRRKGARPPALRGFEIRAARPQSLRALRFHPAHKSLSHVRATRRRARRARARASPVLRRTRAPTRRGASRARRVISARARAPRRQLPPRCRRQRATEPLCPLARRWSGELMPAARPPEHTRPRRRAGAYGAAATASLLRATDRADAPLERVYDQRTELVWLCVLGAFEARRIAVDLRHPRSVRRRSSRPRSFSSRQQVKGR